MSIWHVEQQPRLIEELGRVTVRWAALDLLLVQIAAVALNNGPAAQSSIFCEGNAGRQRLRIFDRLIGASFFEAEERAEILALTGELSKLLPKRNALIHEPMEGTYNIDGKKIHYNLNFVSREGKKRDATLKEIQEHVAAVDLHLEYIELFLDRVVEKYVITHHSDEH